MPHNSAYLTNFRDFGAQFYLNRPHRTFSKKSPHSCSSSASRVNFVDLCGELCGRKFSCDCAELCGIMRRIIVAALHHGKNLKITVLKMLFQTITCRNTITGRSGIKIGQYISYSGFRSAKDFVIALIYQLVEHNKLIPGFE